MEFSEKLDLLEKSLNEFRGSSPAVKAEKANPFFKSKYADFNAIVSQVGPEVAAAGLCVSQVLTHIDGNPALYTRLSHVESGQFMASSTPLVLKDRDPQAQGSSITYLKRYAYVTILGLLVDKDDDGNAGSGRKTASTAKIVPKIHIPAEPQKKTAEDIRADIKGINDLIELRKYYAALPQSQQAVFINPMKERAAELGDNNAGS